MRQSIQQTRSAELCTGETKQVSQGKLTEIFYLLTSNIGYFWNSQTSTRISKV